MRDTRDRWRSGPPAPFRYRLQRPAALPHAQRTAQQCRALRQERSSSTMTCEAAGKENALSDFGPLRPACERRSLNVTFGFQACPAPPVTAGGNLYSPSRLGQNVWASIVGEK